MKNLTLYRDIACALTLEPAVKKSGKNLLPEDLGVIKNPWLIADGEQIVWIGTEKNLPEEIKKNISQEHGLNHQVITPALIDSHTHLIFAGNRAQEYTQRLSGKSYEDIAKSGGGITYSSQQTNQASKDELYQLGTLRLQELYALGIGACEIKTGYSLTLDGELQLLEIINLLKKQWANKIHISPTLLAAHAIPKEMNKRDYMQKVVLPSITKSAKNNLASFVDVFHEINYFDQKDVEEIFVLAQSYNLPLKLHADELNNNSGALLATRFGCTSADHLLCTDPAGIKALADSNTIATLLPGTAFFLGKKLPNAKAFLSAGCAIALASDFNPGSCHFNDLFQIARMSAPSLGMNPGVLWCAITYNAAQALNLKKWGALIPGFRNKILRWEASSTDDLLYDWCQRPTCHFL